MLKLMARSNTKPFSSLPIEDILSWINHFENVANYHLWSDEQKAHEIKTLLEGVAATWLTQNPLVIKQSWLNLWHLMIQCFAYHNATQTALQQLKSLKQQQFEPVA